MISLERILCPVDFSDCAWRALGHAAAVAAWYESRLSVMHVFANAPMVDVATSLGMASMPPISLKDTDRAELLESLRRFTAPVTGTVAAEVLLREAPDVRTEILAQATELEASLLVMGAHGRSGVERLLLGSVTETVLRKAACPVLVVPRQAEEAVRTAAAPFKRILCSVDFSAASARALTYALDFAREADAQLTLLHVVELSPQLLEVPEALNADVARVTAATEADVSRRLRALVPDEARAYCTVMTGVVYGRASQEILKIAAAGHADLIVMGVRGRGAVDRLMFGSTTHGVIRGSNCPVLTVLDE